MMSSNYQRTFSFFGIKVDVSSLIKKKTVFYEKRTLTISLFGNCMTTIFLIKTKKFFSSSFENSRPRKVFFVQPQNELCKKTFAKIIANLEQYDTFIISVLSDNTKTSLLVSFGF